MELEIYFDQNNNFYDTSFYEDIAPGTKIFQCRTIILKEEALSLIDFYDQFDLRSNFTYSLSGEPAPENVVITRKNSYNSLIITEIENILKYNTLSEFTKKTLNNLSTYDTKYAYEKTLELKQELEDPNTEIFKLCIWKQKLCNEIDEFFNTQARKITISSPSYSEIVLANQSFSDLINSAKIQAENNEKNTFLYRTRDTEGNLILSQGKTQQIQITLSSLKIISSIVEKRRGYCFWIQNYHKSFVSNSEKIINNYNYLIDDLGENYAPSETIILDEIGNIVN